jgi:hypothetical protein
LGAEAIIDRGGQAYAPSNRFALHPANYGNWTGSAGIYDMRKSHEKRIGIGSVV